MKELYCIIVLLFSQFLAAQSPLASQNFGVFDFDIDQTGGATVGDQLDIISNIGYNGLALNFTHPAGLTSWNTYHTARPDTKLIAGFMTMWLDDPDAIDSTHSTQVFQTLAAENAHFWCIFRRARGAGSNDLSGLQSLVDRVARRAATFGLDLIIYPHDIDSIFAIETLEEAMVYATASAESNIKVSAHLCHEIRAGNGHRLEEVLRAAGNRLSLVTICGANVAYSPNNLDWSDSIQPLASGDFDARLMVDALERVGYRGPVILHTFGLADDAPAHFQASYNLWQSWMAASRPTMTVYSAEQNEMSFGFSGILQVSTNLTQWTDLDPQPTSPFSLPTNLTSQFYRARSQSPDPD